MEITTVVEESLFKYTTKDKGYSITKKYIAQFRKQMIIDTYFMYSHSII